VAEVLAHNPLNNGFRLVLSKNKYARWLYLVRRLMDIQLTDHKDVFVWNLPTAGVYTVRSLYLEHIIVITTEVYL
jgi:hypothetical protein